MTVLDKAAATLEAEMRAIGARARAAASVMALTEPGRKTEALHRAAAAIRADATAILDANAEDMAEAAGALSAAMRDRLLLDEKRVEGIANGLDEVAILPDPIGTELARWTRPNGLDIARVRIPLGVIGIIYESRPNVTADAGGLALRAGNAAILRGGSESFHSSDAIAAGLRRGIAAAGLPADAVQLVPSRDREAVGMMLRMPEFIDIMVPRGGKGLIERVEREARMPVIAHLEGNCHVYIHEAADAEKARRIVMNAKMRRTGVCGAAETLLIDRAIATAQLPAILAELHQADCEIRGDAAVRALDPAATPASEQDWFTEYLGAILAVRVVDGLEEAIRHVNHYGSRHTDAIATEDRGAAEQFLTRIDSAIVLWNASTQFADGGEFGMGAEIGIGTGRLPPRGPVGAEQLTSYKYVVRGTGQVRP
ncbi:MAG: glutamate-5-semialdehyde dehydrogenase [Stellaceae bacterium]